MWEPDQVEGYLQGVVDTEDVKVLPGFEVGWYLGIEVTYGR